MYSKDGLTTLWLAYEGAFFVLLYLVLRRKRDPRSAARSILRYWPLWISLTFIVMVTAPVVAGAQAAATYQHFVGRNRP